MIINYFKSVNLSIMNFFTNYLSYIPIDKSIQISIFLNLKTYQRIRIYLNAQTFREIRLNLWIY